MSDDFIPIPHVPPPPPPNAARGRHGRNSRGGRRSHYSNTRNETLQNHDYYHGGRGSVDGRRRSDGRHGGSYKQRFNGTSVRSENNAETPHFIVNIHHEVEMSGKSTIDDGDDAAGMLRIAVEGCAHGELDQIYQSIVEDEKKTGKKVDVLLCCGDFQSIRNEADLNSMAVPDKYKKIGSFYKYYSGEKRAPVSTIFIGGNHEASSSLQELFYGGWVAPNIYYMGCAGVIRFGGIRIAGMSGIYKEHDYPLGHHERPPYDRSTIRSVYHVRNAEVFRLSQLREPVDIVMSHDWPRGIEQNGDTEGLVRKKPFFRKEIEQNALGSPASEHLLNTIRPARWFSAHLHVKFEAVVKHSPDVVLCENSDRKKLSSIHSSTQFVGLESDACSVGVETLSQQMTRFLALDKCLPRRQCMQILSLPRPASETGKPKPQFEYDLEWLVIVRKTSQLTLGTRVVVRIPTSYIQVTVEDKEEVIGRLKGRFENCKGTPYFSDLDGAINPLRIPDNFQITASPYGTASSLIPLNVGRMIGNPQTDSLLSVLELPHIVTIPYEKQQRLTTDQEQPSCLTADLQREINPPYQAAMIPCFPRANDIDEIDLDD